VFINNRRARFSPYGIETPRSNLPHRSRFGHFNLQIPSRLKISVLLRRTTQTAGGDPGACRLQLTVFSRCDVRPRGGGGTLTSSARAKNPRPSRCGVRPGNRDNGDESASVVACVRPLVPADNTTQCRLSRRQKRQNDSRVFSLLHGLEVT